MIRKVRETRLYDLFTPQVRIGGWGQKHPTRDAGGEMLTVLPEEYVGPQRTGFGETMELLPLSPVSR